MAAQNPTKAKFVKTQGTQLSVSKTTTLDPADPSLDFADLSVTIKQPQFQGGQSDEIEVTTLASEAALLAAYLDVLAVRMGDRLRYRIDVPEELRGYAMAPMLLQPVVENAISHGLEPKVEGGEIVISARLLGDGVCVQVSDTGAGLGGTGTASHKPGGGVGLSNLRERLRSLYGGAARVELLENQPCGMTVRLMLPLNASPTSILSTPS